MTDERGHRIRTGIAGEFFVAGELSRRGWIATLTAKNTPDFDVLASHPTGDTQARIQVKTRTSAYKYAHRVSGFRLDGHRDFLVLVDIGGDEHAMPTYWIIPARAANKLLVNGQIRTREISQYMGRWDLLDEHGPATAYP